MYLYPTLLHIQKFVTVLYYIVDYNTLVVKRKTTSRHFTPIILKLTPLLSTVEHVHVHVKHLLMGTLVHTDAHVYYCIM